MIAKLSEFPELAIVYARDKAGHQQPLPSERSDAPATSGTARIPKPGEELETIVRNIERLLSRSGASEASTSVQKNVHLADRNTGHRREFDVVIRVSESLRETITAIECKDESRRVDVGRIEAYDNKCRSCGVHHAVFVSRAGFSKAALAKANEKNIDCFTLREAAAPNWLRDIGISLMVTKPRFGSCEIRWNPLDLPWGFIADLEPNDWEYIMPFGNPFQELVQRAMELQRGPDWSQFSEINVKCFMNPDKIQLRNKNTGEAVPAHLFSIEVVLEVLEHPVLVSHREYASVKGDKGISAGVGSFNFMGFEGTVTLIGEPFSTVAGQIEIANIEQDADWKPGRKTSNRSSEKGSKIE